MRLSLREQIETLQEENRLLREILMPPAIFPAWMKLTPTAQRIALAIRSASPNAATRDRLWLAAYGHRTDGGPLTLNNIYVHTSQIRKALDGTGVNIVARQCVGWIMDLASAERFDELVSKRN